MERDAIIKRLIEREGGFVDHPSDRGGQTKYGITEKAYAAWRDTPGSEGWHAALVADITLEDAIYFYADLYDAAKIDTLPASLREHVFDCVVHHGQGQAIELLQYALGYSGFYVYVDGILGPQTLLACQLAFLPLLQNHIVWARSKFLRRLVRNIPSQQVFLNGWLNRAESFRATYPTPESPFDPQASRF